MKIKFNWPLPIAGLEISDLFLRYAHIHDGRPHIWQVGLASGAVVEGVIKNKNAFSNALISLKEELPKPYHHFGVVVTAFSSQVHATAISVPAGAGEEARRLALTLAQPAGKKSIRQSFVKLENTISGRDDFFVAFIDEELLTEYKMILIEAGFNVIAFEFPGISLCRAARHLSAMEGGGAKIIVGVFDDGLVFAGMADGRPHFSNFLSWQDLRREEHAVDEKAIAAVLKRITDFYAVKFGYSAPAVVLFVPQSMSRLADEVQKILGYKVKMYFNWPSAAGAALRRVDSLSEEITLFDNEAMPNYIFGRTSFFIYRWGRNFAAALAALAAALILANLSFWGINSFLTARTSDLSSDVAADLADLQKEATEFNSLISRAVSANNKQNVFSPALRSLNESAGSKITLERVGFSNDKKVAIAGKAAGEAEAIAFRKRLEAVKNFTAVDLPLSSLIANTDGTVSFTASLRTD